MGKLEKTPRQLVQARQMIQGLSKGSGEGARISAKIELVTSTIFSSTPELRAQFGPFYELNWKFELRYDGTVVVSKILRVGTIQN